MMMTEVDGISLIGRPLAATLEMIKHYLHLCASVTKQYNLVPAKKGDLFGWESTAGLVESNGSLPLGLLLMSPVGWLPRKRDQLCTQCS